MAAATEISESHIDLVEEQRRASALLAAPRLEGYQVLAYLGEGTYGDVWKARDIASGAVVAIKRFRKQPVGQSRSEVKMLAGLDAARGIVAIKSHHLESEPYCYVMEYIDGGTLGNLITARKKLPFHEACRIYRQVAEALEYVHKQGAVHCDIKPENILMDARGNPRLTDFGQSRGQGPKGSSLGTRFYMPPEQARLSMPDPRWDVYALGAIFYEMVTGTKPRYDAELSSQLSTQTKSGTEFRDRLDQYADHLERSPKPAVHRRVQGIDRTFAELIDRCLAVESVYRPQDAGVLIKLIEAWEKKRRRRPLLILGGILPAVALLIAGMLVLIGGSWALNESETEWVAQIVDDNQAIANAVAVDYQKRFNERQRIVAQVASDRADAFAHGRPADDSDGSTADISSEKLEWNELLANPDSDGTVEALENKLEKTFWDFRDHKLDRWTVTRVDGKVLYVFGEMERDKPPRDDPETKMKPPFRWRSWFNSHMDVKDERGLRQAYIDATDGKKILKERLARGRATFLSQPYVRQGTYPSWTLTISSVVTSENEPVGVVSGQFDYLEFNDSILRFEELCKGESKNQNRRIVIANGAGQTVYHTMLADLLSKYGTASEQGAAKAPEVLEADRKVVAQMAKSNSVAFRDPWQPQSTEKYFVGHASIQLEGGQTLNVFALHEEEDAIHGFNQIRTSAWLYGGGLLLFGLLSLIGNTFGLYYFLRREENPANA